jgi:hypothetical protein
MKATGVLADVTLEKKSSLSEKEEMKRRGRRKVAREFLSRLSLPLSPFVHRSAAYRLSSRFPNRRASLSRTPPGGISRSKPHLLSPAFAFFSLKGGS